MNEYISNSEFYAGLILLVTSLKFGYDFVLSPWIRRRQRRNGMNPEQAAKAKGKRDRTANLLTFGAMTFLSSLVLLDGFSSTDVDQQDIDHLQSQIDGIKSSAEDGQGSIEQHEEEQGQ